jgi:plastocyanin
VLLAGLSTGHEIGLGLTAAIFIAFALLSSFVAPRKWPDFPGQHGLPVFIIASFVLFFAMVGAVEVFGVEEEEAAAGEHAAPEGGGAGEVQRTIRVRENEFRILLPAARTLPPGEYDFTVRNVGKVPHDLVIEGGTLDEEAKTALLDPGESAELKVSLGKGSYELYCSVPGHREAGMEAKLAVG